MRTERLSDNECLAAQLEQELLGRFGSREVTMILLPIAAPLYMLWLIYKGPRR